MIINYEHISSAKTIAADIDEERVVKHIKEVETLWVIPAFSPAVYYKIEQSVLMDNEAHPITDNENNLITFTHLGNYDTLLVGGYYNDNSAYFPGLIQAVSYLAYSRFVKDQQINVTAFGVVVKNSQFSEPASDAMILKNAKDAEKIGIEYLNQCVDYLKFIGEIGVKKSFKVKFKSIGK